MSMKDPSKLSKKKLEEIARSIQYILWGDGDEKGMVFDPNKEWDVDFVEYIEQTLSSSGLKPTKRFRPR